ncbi:MAG: hypothetical protein Q9168_003559 [Polycauliona sp. 1 TL-2023]
MLGLPGWFSRSGIDHPGDIDPSPRKDFEATPETAIVEREAPNLLNIPLETRYHIFSWIVRNDSLTTERDDDDIPGILLVNRQLNSEAYSYIYKSNDATMHIYSDCVWFLGLWKFHSSHWYTKGYNQLPRYFPYSALKIFVIKIRHDTGRCSQKEAYNIRRMLRQVCGQFLEYKVHFRQLHIEFTSSVRKDLEYDDGQNRSITDRWDEIWDSENPDHSAKAFLTPHYSFHDDVSYSSFPEEEKHLEHPDRSSTFAMVLSVFALCPAIADECVIALPESLKGKNHMRKVADRYEMVLDGRLALENEDFLEEDQWVLSHTAAGENYPLRCDNKACKMCVRKQAVIDEDRRGKRERRRAEERLFHAWGLKDNILPPGIEIRECPLSYYWHENPGYLHIWERIRMSIMKAMEERMGVQEDQGLGRHIERSKAFAALVPEAGQMVIPEEGT